MKSTPKYFLIATLVLVLSACNGIGMGDEGNADTATAPGFVDSMSQYNDDLEKAETDNQRAHAQGILEGRIAPGDDEMTIRCMDSTMSPNAATRRFYFKVLGVIISKSDGALSEAASSYLKTIFETYPADFLAFYRDPHTIRDAVESFLAFEFESMEPSAVDNYFAAVQSACTTCTADDKQLIESIKKKVAQEARRQAATDKPQE